MATPTVPFAAALAAQGLDPDALDPDALDPAALDAAFVAYAGGDDAGARLDALCAQFALIDLGVRAERQGDRVIYRGAGGTVLGCECLAPPDDADLPPAALDALVALAEAEDALSAGILTRTRSGTLDHGGWTLPLRAIAAEALRVGQRRR